MNPKESRKANSVSRKTEAALHAIASIQVRNLFGLYDYDLGPIATEPGKGTPLMILYGDNGSGKTTILKLLFHLLSPEDNRGHRTALAGIPFTRFAVRLTDGTQIQAERSSGQLTGSYSYYIQRPGVEAIQVRLPVDANNDVVINKGTPQEQQKWAALIGVLRSLQLSLYYLPDDRKAKSPTHSPDDLHEKEQHRLIAQHLLIHGDFNEERESVLKKAIKRTEEWIRTETIKASNIGDADANKIYTDIVHRLAQPTTTQRTSSINSKTLVDTLKELEQKSLPYSTLGLVSPFRLNKILDILTNAPQDKRRFIGEVLQPYVNGLQARLNALQAVQELLQAFVESINAFFTNKQAVFDLHDGLQIVSKQDQFISPEMLSSGERQLLLLFCNTVTARQHSSMFIIDEPEISLNIKWQRRLLGTLLNLVKGTQVQFIVATHSIELLTQFRSSVLQLQNIEDHAGR